MQKIALIFIGIVLIAQISAYCSDRQIDINSALLEKLDEIIWVGPATAEKIINTRPFESVDDLTKVSGIGEVKLSDIKTQGLACVDYEKEKSEEKENTAKEKQKKTDVPEETTQSAKEQQWETPAEEPTIKLNTQTIKSEGNKDKLNKTDYARYGFILFCVILIILFVIKSRRKNEFEE